MSLCTTTELATLTGSALPTATLQAIIDQAERTATTYLAPHKLSLSGDTAKAAVLSLAQAGVARHLKPEADVTSYRAEAFALLDQIVADQDHLPANSNIAWARSIRGE
jgi:hypothetical protein